MTSLTPAINFCAPMPAWKRATDITCCLLALPVFALITLVMIFVTKMVSPGPVFFKQLRIGYRQRRFMCYKFRTMFAGADSKTHQRHCEDLIHSNGPLVKMDARNDSRVIPGGWLLRASGLDELPQLINVLRGDMSLVGPRPCVLYEYEQFQPWHMERFNAVPGLTGLWQVSGKNRSTFEEMLRFDIRYARNISWWRDLKIILMTLPTLFLQIRDIYRARKSSSQSSLRPRVVA